MGAFSVIYWVLFRSLIKMYQASVAPSVVTMPGNVRDYVRKTIKRVVIPLIIGSCAICWLLADPCGERVKGIPGSEYLAKGWLTYLILGAAGFGLWGLSFILFRSWLRHTIVEKFKDQVGYPVGADRTPLLQAAHKKGLEAYREWAAGCPASPHVGDRGLFWAIIGGIIGLLIACLIETLVTSFPSVNSAVHDREGLFLACLVALGPPLLWCLLLLLTVIQQGLYSKFVREEDREWTASIASWLLAAAFRWFGLFGLAIFGPFALYRLGVELSSLLASGWLLTTIGGVLAGKSGLTGGSDSKLRWLEALARIAPYVFVIGLFVALAFAFHQVTLLYHSHTTAAKAAHPNESGGELAAPGSDIVKADPNVSVKEGAAGAESDIQRAIKKWFRNELELFGLLSHSEAATDCPVSSFFERGVQNYFADVAALPPAKPCPQTYKSVWLDPVWKEFFSQLGYIGGVLLCGYVFSRCVGVNTFSLQNFYRNRLVRCYMGASRPVDGQNDPHALHGAPCNANPPPRRPEPITGFAPHDDFPLKELASLPDGTQNPGPFHLINTALNLVRGDDLAWQERKAASFLLSPLYCGCNLTGYRRTEEFASSISLGTAMAISGSALAPNMGYHSSPAVTALLTFFNVRLGAWLGNPRMSNWQDREPTHSLRLLFTELFGQTNRLSDWVYLSDGGHFDNLGLYELVRRRVRFIVVCDADADPDYEFESLGSVVRKCRSDFGVPIEIDVTPIKPQAANGRSKWHCAVGAIRYDKSDPPALPGILLYLKSSLTGDEPSDVLNYAVEHAPFPHESTVEQFFTESQFEAYRAGPAHLRAGVRLVDARCIRRGYDDQPGPRGYRV